MWTINVVDLSLVRSYLPPTASEEWGNGQVLVTTQDTQSIPFNAPYTYYECLSKGMHPDDAVDLLTEISQISNQQQAEEIAEVLEFSDDEPQDKLVKANYFGVQGLVCSDLGQYNQAKEYQEKSLVFQKEIYGEQHGEVAASYNNLGTVYRDLGQYNQAEEYYGKSLAISKELYGEHHGDVATSYNNLGTVYSDLGQYNQAEDYNEKSLAIRKELYASCSFTYYKSY